MLILQIKFTKGWLSKKLPDIQIGARFTPWLPDGDIHVFGPSGFWTMAPLRCAPPCPPPWRNPRKGRDQILPSGNHDRRGIHATSGIHLFGIGHRFQRNDVAVEVEAAEAEEHDDPEDVADVVEEVADPRDGTGRPDLGPDSVAKKSLKKA